MKTCLIKLAAVIASQGYGAMDVDPELYLCSDDCAWYEFEKCVIRQISDIVGSITCLDKM